MKRWIKIQIFYWIPVYLSMGAIFYLSSLSYIPIIETKVIGGGFFIPSYLKHVVEYMFLGFLSVRASKRSGFENYFLFGMIILGLYALSDEFHQIFIAGREFDLIDWFFDVVGGFIGCKIFLSDIFKGLKLRKN